MRKGRRSGERLFCWPKLHRGSRGPSTPQSDRYADRSAPLRMTTLEGAGAAMRSTALGTTALRVAVLVAVTTYVAWAAGPALTTISDTVYRADGTAAAGTVLISWPAFQTAEGDVVAAGNQSVAIGAGGSFTVQLVPNAGASPAGTYYTVVFQLDDYSVRTEYWSVPATSPTTITAVRTTPGVGLANPAATQQYVNAAVASRALDSAVVHLTGAETITGSKQFAAPPVLPAPVGTNDAATKAYVDGAVANVGAGSFVAKAGDTMEGPLTLAGERNDIKRNVYDRIVTATIAFVVSAIIALHEHLGFK